MKKMIFCTKPVSGDDDSMVSEASGAAVQVCEGFHDRDGHLQQPGVTHHPVPCSTGQ